MNYTQPDLSNYDKVITYANAVLGDNPSMMLRDWQTLGGLSLNGEIQPNEYVDAERSANLLLVCFHSYWGYVSGPYGLGERYAHGPVVSYEQTARTARGVIILPARIRRFIMWAYGVTLRHCLPRLFR